MKKQLLFNLIFLLGYTLTYAQSISLKGSLVDDLDKPLIMTELLCLGQDSVKRVAISDEKGQFLFELAPGSYTLSVYAFNQIAHQQKLTLKQSTDLGKLSIQNSIDLSEATIVKRPPLIEKEIDRFVFHAKNSIAATGGTAMDLLRVTPLISIQDDALSLIGKSTLGIMVNGRKLMLSNSEMINYLKSIRSEKIEKIEVITTPPSNYDSDGNSGLLNIILKKDENIGWNVSAGVTYRQRTYAGISPFVSLNYQKSGINFSWDASSDIDVKAPNSTFTIFSPIRDWRSVANRKDNSTVKSSNLNVSYKVNRNTEIGLLTSGYVMDYRMNSLNDNKFSSHESNIPDSTLLTTSLNKNRTNFYSITGYFDKQLDSSGKKLSINTNLLKRVNHENIQLSSQTTIANSLSSNLTAVNPTSSKYQVFSVNADLVLPFRFAKIESGVKTIWITNQSTTSFLVTPKESLRNQSQNAQFNYSENIAAFYATTGKQFGKRLSVKAGLRYEHSLMRGKSSTLNVSTSRNFNNLFPTAYISYLAGSSHSLSLMYSKRIGRPNFNAINPNRYYQNQYIYSTGNPALIPSYTNNLELSYVLNNNLSISTFVYRQNHAIGQITAIASDSLITRPANAYTESVIGISTSYTWNITKFWEGFYSFRISGNKSTPLESLQIPINKGFSSYFSTYNTISLGTHRRYQLLVNYFHFFRGRSGLYQLSARSGFDVGIKSFFINKNLQCSLIFYDLFKTNRTQTKRIIQNNQQNNSIYNDMRYLSVGVTYRFGSNKIKGVSKRVINEEKNRIN